MLNGTYTVCNGSVHVPDGDVTAEEISVLDHEHTDVQKGPDVSGPPVGGGNGSEGGGSGEGDGDDGFVDDSYWELLFEIVRNLLPMELTQEEEILLCIPEIAQAEAEKCWLDKDKRGWLNLRDMLRRWFSGPANDDAESNPKAFWIDINWVLSYERIKSVYRNFIMDDVLFYQKARDTLAHILNNDEFLGTTRIDFDYT